MALNEISVANKTATAKKIEEKESTSLYENNFVSTALARNYDVDVLSQFRANLEQVEDLNHRLRFVLNEVQGLIIKRR